MTTTYLTPLATEGAIDLSQRLFRKQLLPLGEIEYNGQKLSFDQQYLTDLAEAYKGGAFDQTAIQLADGENKHNSDPEKYRGEVKGVEVTDDGLYGTIEFASDEAAKLVRDNPKLGVSARIVEGLKRADGKEFKRALQHVLLTLDPRVTGMKPWEEVTLSNEVQSEVVDLTNSEYKEEVVTTNDGGGQQFNQGGQIPPGTVQLTNDTGQAIPVQPVMTDEQFARFLELSAQQTNNPQTTELSNQLAAVELQLANERWEKERAALLNDGVPPALLDLAGNVLSQPGSAVIELSNNKSVDTKGIIRGMLGMSKGYVQLAAERGHTFGEELDPQKREDALLQQLEDED